MAQPIHIPHPTSHIGSYRVYILTLNRHILYINEKGNERNQMEKVFVVFIFYPNVLREGGGGGGPSTRKKQGTQHPNWPKNGFTKITKK